MNRVPRVPLFFLIVPQAIKVTTGTSFLAGVGAGTGTQPATILYKQQSEVLGYYRCQQHN